ncbi:MAG: hypothetical protein AAFZ52_10575 [Bacteroidota bacterium]
MKLVALLVLVLLELIGLRTETQEDPPIEEIFLALPADAFSLGKLQPAISQEHRQIILRSTTWSKAQALMEDFAFDTLNGEGPRLPIYKLDTTQLFSNYLEFQSLADDGFVASLKTWKRVEDGLLVGLNVSEGDMCCDYSEIKFYLYQDTVLTEVTEQVFPELGIDHFATQISERARALLPPPLQHTFHMYPSNDTIEVTIDHTPQIYDFYESNDLDDELVITDQALKLTWDGNKFTLVR